MQEKKQKDPEGRRMKMRSSKTAKGEKRLQKKWCEEERREPEKEEIEEMFK